MELNPVRAGLVAHPADSSWSSDRTNALGESDLRVPPLAMYLGLGGDAAQRQAAYRGLCEEGLAPAERAGGGRGGIMGAFPILHC